MVVTSIGLCAYYIQLGMFRNIFFNYCAICYINKLYTDISVLSLGENKVLYTK